MATTKITSGTVGAGAISANTMLATGVVTAHATAADIAKTDVAQSFTAAQRGTITALGVYHGLSGNTVTLSLGTTNHYSLTSNANLTFANPTLTNVIGQCGSIVITANGNFTGSWGSYWRFPGGTAPTLSANTATQTPPYQDRIDYFVVSSNTIHAVASLNVAGTA